jgi:hypothetical protein
MRLKELREWNCSLAGARDASFIDNILRQVEPFKSRGVFFSPISGKPQAPHLRYAAIISLRFGFNGAHIDPHICIRVFNPPAFLHRQAPEQLLRQLSNLVPI